MSVKITVFSDVMQCTTLVHTAHLKVEATGLFEMLVPLFNHMASDSCLLGCYAVSFAKQSLASGKIVVCVSSGSGI
jgi:type IV secretory pathway protease TraF